MNEQNIKAKNCSSNQSLGCIYRLSCLVNFKVYIGQTIKKPLRRWKTEHRWALRKNKHKNKHLQAAWNLYGETSFVFEVIEEFDPEMNFSLDYLEQYWINFYDSKNPEKGYNMTDGGGGTKGWIPTLATRNAISLGNKGKKRTTEVRAKMSESQKNREPISEETREKKSLALKGQKCFWYGKVTPKAQRVKAINIETLETLIFDSKRRAASYFKVAPSTINSACKIQHNNVKGFKLQNEDING